MTENEIIEILQTEKACVIRAMKNECNRDCYNCDLCEEGKDILTVYDSVIKALEEREQYRAIGTVEEFKILIKKNEPQMAYIFGDGYSDGRLVYDTYQCPNYEKTYELEYEEYKFCPNCGQHLKIDLKGAE